MRYTKTEKICKYIPFVIFVLYQIYKHMGVAMIADDLSYQNALDNINVFAWCRQFYVNWGGRVPLQLIDIYFLRMPMVCWKFFNIALLLLLAVYMCRMISLFYKDMSEQKRFILYTFVCYLIVKIPEEIAAPSIYWITGSFNYLWPTACLIMALYPFLAQINKKKINTAEWIVSFVVTFFACYAEQTSAVFICFGMACLAFMFKERTISKNMIALYVFGLINSLIQYLAPGNAVRSQAELLRWYHEFDMYGLLDRVVMGIVHCVKIIFTYGSIFIVLFIVVLGIQMLVSDRIDQILFLAEVALTLVTVKICEELKDEAIWDVYNKKQLLALGIVIFWIMLSAWIIFSFLKLFEIKVLTALLFLAAFACGIVMGMSPTIYASGNRVFLSSFIIFIFASSLILADGMHQIKE